MLLGAFTDVGPKQVRNVLLVQLAIVARVTPRLWSRVDRGRVHLRASAEEGFALNNNPTEQDGSFVRKQDAGTEPGAT